MAVAPGFQKRLDEMRDIHERKNAGYAGAGNPDHYANFRRAEEAGVPAWKGALIRLSDKVSRAMSLAKSADNEQVGESMHDTLIDLANYALIVDDLYEQAQSEPEVDGVLGDFVKTREQLEDADSRLVAPLGLPEGHVVVTSPQAKWAHAFGPDCGAYATPDHVHLLAQPGAIAWRGEPELGT